MLSSQELEIIQHSLGVDKYGLGERYRNHFVTSLCSNDSRVCHELVSRGLMTKHPRSELTGGDFLFRVTESGVKAMIEESPKPPKKTRSQQRYQKFLDADLGISFREWLSYEESNH